MRTLYKGIKMINTLQSSPNFTKAFYPTQIQNKVLIKIDIQTFKFLLLGHLVSLPNGQHNIYEKMGWYIVT